MQYALKHIINLLLICLILSPLLVIFLYKKIGSKNEKKIDLHTAILYLVLFIISMVLNKGAYYLRPLLLITSIFNFYRYNTYKNYNEQ